MSGFLQRVTAVTKRHLSNLQEMHDRRVKEAEAKARAKLAIAKTKAEKEKVRLSLEREKLNLKRELYEARTATQKAKTAVKKARLEAGDLTIGERAEALYRGLTKPRRRVRRRPATNRKTTKRR